MKCQDEIEPPLNSEPIYRYIEDTIQSNAIDVVFKELFQLLIEVENDKQP